jgi:hypothetical protein
MTNELDADAPVLTPSPGPWRCLPGDWVVRSQEGAVILDAEGDDTIDYATACANARLAAAAPSMRHALAAIVHAIEHLEPVGGDILVDCKEALALAEPKL